MMSKNRFLLVSIFPVMLLLLNFSAVPVVAVQSSDEVEIITVEGQPLAANILRVLEALQTLGHPLERNLQNRLKAAASVRDGRLLQQLMDSVVLAAVHINPEVRVQVKRGAAHAELQQHGFVPVLIKVHNQGAVETMLHIKSPQGGAVYAGASLGILKRQAQTELNRDEDAAASGSAKRFLDIEVFRKPPMTTRLSGLTVEYVIALISSAEFGNREATLQFDVGSGTQDLGFRGELPVLFRVQPAVAVKLYIRDENKDPSLARLIITDSQGRVYPSQIKRLAPDLFFQPQVYRADGETVLLPAGEYEISSSRGPEYQVQHQRLRVEQAKNGQQAGLEVKLRRWIDPNAFGYFSGDHHIHGAGCSHYTSPTEGVTPADMFRQVKGEGLNVGCVLTWGPCFDFQRQYFSPVALELSEPRTLLKYDLEISGFGSAAMGHVCLLNLKDQTYPGSKGTKTDNWPSWTVPVLRWCKEQGGVTGYPHSALGVDEVRGAQWTMNQYDTNTDGEISAAEYQGGLFPATFEQSDKNRDQALDREEIENSLAAAAEQLPNYAIAAMSGRGAMEILVSVPEGVCDFISAMDTPRVSEWNTWYHLLNCGFPLKLSGETDFPCMSSRRVGQGRVYVQLGDVKRVDYSAWCLGLGKGQSYVSDGYAHALSFAVDGHSAGRQDVELPQAGSVQVTADVAFAPATPVGVAYGTLDPESNRVAGDTVQLHAPRSLEFVKGGQRIVELVVNGQKVAQQRVAADGKVHQLKFDIEITQSSWVALRQFPQLHTNPVNVIVAEKPIRASRRSAQWCLESTRQLWKLRNRYISQEERDEAWLAYERSIKRYMEIMNESANRD